MRVVLDTNVILSGLMYPDSIPGRIVQAWRGGRFEMVTSIEQLAEIGRTLAYPKIRKVLGWDDDRIGHPWRRIRNASPRIDPCTDAAPGPGASMFS